MAKKPRAKSGALIKSWAPDFTNYTQKVLFGEVWERPGLSKRDRSMITVAALISAYRPEQLESHLVRAVDNGVTKEELTEIITHLAFYCGWPAAVTAGRIVHELFYAEEEAAE